MVKTLVVLLVILGLLGCGREQSDKPRRDPDSAGRPAVAFRLPPPPVPPAQGEFGLTPLTFAQLPGWHSDDPSGALTAFRRSCAVFARRPASAEVGAMGQYGNVADWLPACTALGEPGAYDAASARRYFETWFQPYLVGSRGHSEGLFTGYYETAVRGALQPGGAYRWPLYGPPADADAYDRAAIDAGALSGKGLEIAWLDDPVDAFDLHIQGSALVTLPDGRQRRIGYAATNGMPFVGIGRLMLERGHIGSGEATAQGVKAWLKRNPDEARTLMQENPRYVFFRWLDSGADGPVGAQGVPLTAGRSLAVDPTYLAYGLPLFLESSLADGRPLNRLMVAQDTGGAIKGPVRGDLFWGTGRDALAIAGGMKQQGRYYLFLPRTLTRVAEAR